MKRRILFRADGNREIGMGHFVRSLALADMLKNDFDGGFAISGPEEYHLNEIIKSGLKVLPLSPGESHFNDFPELIRDGDIVVLDNYYFDTQYQAELKKRNCHLVCIDDIQNHHYKADIVINHSPSVHENDFSCDPETRLLLGTRYALLRKEFLEAAGNPPVYPDKQQLLLAFGGGDKYNLALEYSKIITTIDPDIELNVISGVASGTYENLKRWSESAQLENRVRIFTNQSAGELVSLLTRSSGCILPSSGMMYEALALRRPLITGYFVPNQMKIARDIINDEGGIFYLGDLNNPDHSLLKKILDRIKRINIREVINYQSGIIDGKSNKRLIHEFKKLK